MPTPPGNLRRDVIGAYVASLSRIGSWAIVSGLVIRQSVEAFAIVALVRGTIGVLNYAALGLLPAMIRAFAEARGRPQPDAVDPAPARPVDPPGKLLAYATPQTASDDAGRRRGDVDNPLQRVYGTGTSVAYVAVFVGVVGAVVLGLCAPRIYDVGIDPVKTAEVTKLVTFFGVGIAFRWLGDPASALLQSEGHLFLDNLLQAAAELAWPTLVLFNALSGGEELFLWVGVSYFLSGVALALARGVAARLVGRVRSSWKPDARLRRRLLAVGALITLAQLADFLYAPTDYLLINHLLTPTDLANYAPAVQVDGGLMVLVSGLAAVLLPRAAVAHVAGDRARVRRYYVRGTLATAAMLAVAGAFAWLASPWVFRLWLHDPMPGTRSILPLVLVHTVLGGSSAVGRSILLGIGKAKPLTIAVLIAGGVNVACSYAFVRYLHLGLAGIVLGTIVAVVGRCAVWMPWYVLRELKRGPVREEMVEGNLDAMVVDPGT